MEAPEGLAYDQTSIKNVHLYVLKNVLDGSVGGEGLWKE